MEKLPLLFISGAFTSCEDLIFITRAANEIAIKAWERGWSVISVHKNCFGFGVTEFLTYDQWTKGLLSQIAKCDAILVLPNWENSKGVKIEMKFAGENNIPVYLYNGKDIPEPKFKLG
jgi:hypothetical protein